MVDGKYVFVQGPGNLVKMDSTIYTETNIQTIKIWDPDSANSYLDRYSMNEFGIRATRSITNSENLYEYYVEAFDFDNGLIWEQMLGTNCDRYLRPLLLFASDGTTFVFWSAPGEKEDHRDVFVNVIDLAGNWGFLQTTSAPDRNLVPLPNQTVAYVWPNPTNGLAKFHWNGSGEGRYTLYDILGRQVLVGSVEGGTVRTLNMNGFASGIYLLRITSTSEPLVKTGSFTQVVLVK